MVIVNTVVYVRETLQGSETDVAIALASFGAGSMLVALSLPPLLDRVSDRTVMFFGGIILSAGLGAFAVLSSLNQIGWTQFLVFWLVLGASYSAMLTPSGRLLKRSSQTDTRPEIFAAQFALSHACWLLTYPLAGWLGASTEWAFAFAVFAVLAGCSVLLARIVWPVADPDVLEHTHADIAADDPHVAGAEPTAEGFKHSHRYVIDQHHHNWPRGA